MSSLMTNSQAMTALQTLRSVDANLSTTMNRISTGYRVATASDNAAYWSIATTMRSDVQALGAVQDALGLGAATIDTMYTGLEGTVDVVSSIKEKLVAARTPGVDRAKIQSEITELQKQLKNTADSAVFNGENWISVDSQDPTYNSTKSVVSSFSRAGGVVSVDTLTIDLDAIKLYDTTLDAAYITAHAAATTSTLVFDPATVGAAGPPATTTGTIAFAVTPLGGAVTTTTINVSQTSTVQDIAKALNGLGIQGLTVGVNADGKTLEIKNASTTSIATTSTNGGATGGTVALQPAATANVATQKGVLDQTYDVYKNGGWTTFSVANLDISKFTDSASDLTALETYISGTDKALSKITDAATNLGAIKNRIGLQQDFVKTLTDSLDRGIGQLVDADMNAESTRLQALQTQQQLGIQALSIANAGSQSILSLFRG
ncbi:flagellin N-terminal helical domain-containing protein [Tardiphaga sp. 215_C5_N2_1]|uniref:Flagellin n=1 Tax=Tardiphaga robiniae TaxID=943830 RepID=A0A7G6U406_9BRAD|nr:flagellin [Tardiphaga robiniae]MDR6658274.1 flagellin [Tardiphaga robiniae]QND73738.1 flagellin [Tardiphaga robiniae]